MGLHGAPETTDPILVDLRVPDLQDALRHFDSAVFCDLGSIMACIRVDAVESRRQVLRRTDDAEPGGVPLSYSRQQIAAAQRSHERPLPGRPRTRGLSSLLKVPTLPSHHHHILYLVTWLFLHLAFDSISVFRPLISPGHRISSANPTEFPRPMEYLPSKVSSWTDSATPTCHQPSGSCCWWPSQHSPW